MEGESAEKATTKKAAEGKKAAAEGESAEKAEAKEAAAEGESAEKAGSRGTKKRVKKRKKGKRF